MKLFFIYIAFFSQSFAFFDRSEGEKISCATKFDVFVTKDKKTQKLKGNNFKISLTGVSQIEFKSKYKLIAQLFPSKGIAGTNIAVEYKEQTNNHNIWHLEDRQSNELAIACEVIQ